MLPALAVHRLCLYLLLIYLEFHRYGVLIIREGDFNMPLNAPKRARPSFFGVLIFCFNHVLPSHGSEARFSLLSILDFRRYA